MLETISNVPNWGKVAKGLPKMYVDEVLKKFVVMQHFYFGNTLKLE
jgi:serine/threonine-protein phosphatase 2A activator